MSDYFLHPERDRLRIKIGFGRAKLLGVENFLFAHAEGEIFTNILYPSEVIPGYLIGNQGNVIVYKNPTINYLLRQERGINTGKFTLRVDGAKPLAKKRTDNPTTLRVYRPQFLYLVNFCKLHENVIANLHEYRCLQLENDLKDLDLNKLFLVKKGGYHNKFNLRDVFTIREAWRTTKPKEWADHFGVDELTIHRLLAQKTWQVAEGDLAPIPYPLPTNENCT